MPLAFSRFQRSVGNSAEAPRGVPQATLLLVWLAAITLYRIWIIPRLGITLYVDEAQYWTWAQQPDWGYFSKPPVIAWLIAFSTALFGDGLIAVKLPSLILYPATAWLSFRLGVRLFDARIGFRTGLAFSLMPIVAALGLFVSTDAPLLFFWAAAMLSLLRALDHDRWSDWLLLGISVGLGMMSKYTMAVFGVSALLYLLVDRSRRGALLNHKLWIAAALALLIVLPNIFWNWSYDFPTLHHTADITHVEGVNTKTGNLGEFLLAQVAALGPAIALAFLAGLAMAIRQWREPRMQLLISFSLPLFGIVMLQALRSEANGNWAAPSMIAANMLAIVWLTRKRLRWWLFAALGINIALMLAVYHLNDFYRLTGRTPSAHADPLKRARGWSAFAQQLKPYLDAQPQALLLAENRTLLAHMLYELRDTAAASPGAYAAWAPYASPHDHYQLVAPLNNEHLGRTALLVTQTDYSPIASRFNHAQLLGHISVDVEPGLRREADVVLLEGFKGYR
ncbi:MAG TPA: glycosyltransferase family 39 protein [Rhodocyclaceae bacterium]|nr:glycosyltransferase family 39 protein [Rhodocyclaceae bacterium]